MKKYYLAQFIWPGWTEPLIIGTNKKKLREAAKLLAIEIFGSGPVVRPQAFSESKITLKDIEIIEIPMLKSEE